MYLDEYGRKVYTLYELEHGITVSDEFVMYLKKNHKLPYFFNSIHFIQKCFNSYGKDGITNMHIHKIYELASNTTPHYHNVEIPKRSGGVRTLTIPSPELKKIQKYINDKILKLIPVSDAAMAYVVGKGIKYNAKPHVESNYILKLDISDFFGSIHFGKVINNILPKEYGIEFKTLLANLCMYKGYLPQGAPTSPALSNIVMKKFDDIMIDYCNNNSIKYTRYADDMTFSSIDKFNPNRIINKVKYLLEKYYKMKLNDTKTVFLHNGLKQDICGVIVNDHMQVSKSYRDSIRQEIYYLNKYGVDRHIYCLYYDKKIDRVLKPYDYYIRLLGRINYVLSINPNDKKIIEYQKLIKTYLNEIKEKDGTHKENSIIRNYYENKNDLVWYPDKKNKYDYILNCIQYLNEIDEDIFDEIPMDIAMHYLSEYGPKEYIDKCLKATVSAVLESENKMRFVKNKLYAYLAVVYYINFAKKEEYDLYKKYAMYLKKLGNYRGICLIALYDSNDKEKRKLLKQAALGKDGKAQYEYAQYFKKNKYNEYCKFMLASADNGYDLAYIHAYKIYKECKMEEQAMYYLIKGINRFDEECIKEGNELRLTHQYKFDKEVAGILSRNILG